MPNRESFDRRRFLGGGVAMGGGLLAAPGLAAAPRSDPRNETLRTISSLRSIHGDFSARAIPDDEIEEILAASVRAAPAYWRVLTVIPDSPSSSLNVQTGDLVVRINGEPVARWDYERYAALLRDSARITYTFLTGTREYEVEVPVFKLVP